MPGEAVIGVIGASPIEDLLAREPVAVAALIEAEAPANERLRRALDHTWQFTTPTEIFTRVKRLAQSARG